MTHKIRIAGAHIALVAMLLRALLPAGWMPNANVSGGSPFTICTMSGPVSMVLGPDGKPHKPAPNDAAHHECPFAAAPQFAAPTDFTPLPAPVSIAFITRDNAVARPVFDSSHFSPQSPRGPPTLA